MATSQNPAKPTHKECEKCGKLHRKRDGKLCQTCRNFKNWGLCKCPGGDLCPHPCKNPSEGPDKRCKSCRSDDENQCGRKQFPEGYQLEELLKTVRYEPEVAPLWFPSDWYFRPCRLTPVAQRAKDGYSNELVYQSATAGKVKWAWHQIVYEKAHGPLPEWADRVRHLCGVAACYEQTHLAAGTEAVNATDRVLHAKWGTGSRVVHSVRKATEESVEVAKRIFRLP